MLLNFLKLAFLGYKNLLDNFAISVLETLILPKRLIRLKWEIFKRYALRPPRWMIRLEGINSEDTAYGETPFLTLQNILSWAGYKPSDLFVDLGCGVGKPPLYVAYILGGRAIGVDIVRIFIRKAREIARALKLDNVWFYNEDMIDFLNDLSELRRQEEFKTGDLFLYIPATAFSEDLMTKLQKAMESILRVESNLKVITITKRLKLLEEKKLLNLKAKATLPFSWGNGTVWLYDKGKEGS